VGQARHLVYDAPAKRGSLLSFFGRRYWRIIAERPVPVIVAWLLLLLPALLGALWAAHDPAAASGVLPAKFQGPLRTSAGDLGQPVTLQASLAAQIFTNNIQVTFLAFATGIAAGLGTALVLVYNGLTTGVIAALAWKGGSGSAFGQLVVAHGVLELSAIVVAAAAGMRMGWALIDPGRRRRRDALGDEAGRAVQVVLGTIPWLVLAGLVEGFITPAGFGLRVNTLIGLSLGVVFWSLVLIRGRATSALDSSP
jgi:uncharacterized membrane protein SpoIIM required for sporulation